MVISGSSGCSMTSNAYRELRNCDCLDTFMIDYRNRALAERAWHCQKHQFGNQLYRQEFKDGFVDGYVDVASGGKGCTPSIAPSKYWGWRYQSPQGQAATDAWFSGYPMGARAAEQDGIGYWQQIRTLDSTGISSGMFVPGMTSDHPAGNPVYLDELEPGMIREEEEVIEMGLHGGSGVVPDEPDSVFNETFDSFPVGDTEIENNDLVSRFEVVRRQDATITSMTDHAGTTPNDSNEAAHDDVFGAALDGSDSPFKTTTDAVTDVLPFSFE